jgi:hypothetical protein
MPASCSAVRFASRASLRADERASSTGLMPSRRSAISLRLPGVTSENASSCFCSANTDALNTRRSIRSARHLLVVR